MFGQKEPQKREEPRMSTPAAPTQNDTSGVRLLTVSGDYAKIEGTFEIADSLEVECEIGGELNVRGKLVIGQAGVVNANVRTVDAVIKGSYEGNMVATGNVEIAATGKVMGNITTDSLVISKGGFFNGNVTRIQEDDKHQGHMFLVDEEEAAEAKRRAAERGERSEREAPRPDTREQDERAIRNARNL